MDNQFPIVHTISKSMFPEKWYQGGTSNVNLLSDQQFSIKYNDPKDNVSYSRI